MGRRKQRAGVLVHVEPVAAAAGLRAVAATGHGATGLVEGRTGGQAGAAVAFGGVFEAGHREGVGEAEGLAFFNRHVGRGGGGGGEGAGLGFVGAAEVGPGGRGGGGGGGGGSCGVGGGEGGG